METPTELLRNFAWVYPFQPLTHTSTRPRQLESQLEAQFKKDEEKCVMIANCGLPPGAVVMAKSGLQRRVRLRSRTMTMG